MFRDKLERELEALSVDESSSVENKREPIAESVFRTLFPIASCLLINEYYQNVINIIAIKKY